MGDRLTPGQVHVYATTTPQRESLPEEVESTLSIDERERMLRFVHATDRWRFAVARSGLRAILSMYGGFPAPTIEFGYGPNGKPFLARPSGSMIHFNLSHSEGTVLYALGTAPLGIDVEKVRDIGGLDAVARAYFTEDERAVIEGSGSGRLSSFFLTWVRKEAVLKAYGRSVADFDATAGSSLFDVAPSTVVDLAVRDCVGALASTGPVEDMRAVEVTFDRLFSWRFR